MQNETIWDTWWQTEAEQISLKKKSFSEPVLCVSVILEKPFKKGKVFVVYLTLCYILKMQNLFYRGLAEPVSGLVNVNDCFPN